MNGENGPRSDPFFGNPLRQPVGILVREQRIRRSLKKSVERYGGAITGTLFPQILGTINSVDPSAYAVTTSRWDQAINGFIIVLGTVTTLIYFHYSTQDTPGQNEKRLPIIEQISNIGKVFLAITFGALYAGVFMSALAALVERVASFWDFLNTIGFQLFSSF